MILKATIIKMKRNKAEGLNLFFHRYVDRPI